MESLINERKFTAHSLDTDRALTLIGHFCMPDPVYPVGRVNSIYYDTLQLAAFKEKFEGDTTKRKYRLRWYDVPGDAAAGNTTAFLEIKYRYGSARDKARHKLSLDYRWLTRCPLHDPALTALLRRHGPTFADHLPLDLYPAVCISYDRRRFQCSRTGIIVCVDSAIRADRVNADLFPDVPPFDLQTVVCEFKSPGFSDLPWAASLYHAGFRIRSFSKYGECIHQIKHGGAPTVIRMSI